MSRLVDSKEAGERLGLGKTTMYCWARQNKCPVPWVEVQPGMYRWELDDIEKFINEKKVKL